MVDKKLVLVSIFILVLGGLMTHPTDAFEAVAAGSSIDGVYIASHTATTATLFGDSNTEVPMLSHSINAHVGYGSASAGMVAVGNASETYEYHIKARGRVAQLNSSMRYQSHIRRAHLPMPWFRVPWFP